MKLWLMMQSLSLKACVSYNAAFRVYNTHDHEHTWFNVHILFTDTGQILNN